MAKAGLAKVGAWCALQLHCWARQSSASQISPTQRAAAEGTAAEEGGSTVDASTAAVSKAADLAGFTAAVSTPARSMGAAFTEAGSTAASRACNGFAGGHEGHWYHGWRGGRYGWLWAAPGLAWSYYDYPWWGSYPDYDYYDYSQPYANQTGYYCSDPAGYYPYVTQCNTGWQAVPAS